LAERTLKDQTNFLK